MKPHLPILAPLAAILALAGAAHAKPRTARCAITSAGDGSYRGPCLFVPDKGGSFAVEATGGKRLFSETTNVSVWIVEPGLAEVRGLTIGGINSRWGEARRSRRDPACWEGADFRICVY